MEFITWLDYLMLPVVITLVFGGATVICNRLYPAGHPWRRYFFVGLGMKIAGSIFIGLIYQYYYGGGDTSLFFYHAKVINSSFSDSPHKWLNMLFHIPKAYDGEYFDYISRMDWYGDKSSYIVCSITAFLSLLTINTYLPTSVLFAALSFSGTWAMFLTFARQYPEMKRQVAIATLFIPSCLIWGSGIFKDTICMFALGWMLYSVFQLLIQRNMSFSNFTMLILSFFLLALVKIYILIAFLPAVALWILFYYSQKIRSSLFRFITKTVILFLAGGVFVFAYSYYGSVLGRYSLENIAKTSLITREWIAYSSGDQGSTYDLGQFSPDLFGLLSKLPQAVNVTLFRPYLWEANKSLIFLNALESLIFLFITLKILFTVGPLAVWRTISSDPNIQFCLIFSLIFAFSVGISTYNFGALSRYKIPCLPLYAMALILIYYKNKPLSKKLLF